MKILHFGGPASVAPNLASGRCTLETIANPVLDAYQRGGYRGDVTRARARA